MVKLMQSPHRKKGWLRKKADLSFCLEFALPLYIWAFMCLLFYHKSEILKSGLSDYEPNLNEKKNIDCIYIHYLDYIIYNTKH